MDLAILVEDLWLSYTARRVGRLTPGYVMNRIKRGKKKKIALRGVSLEVPQGQMLGVIGRNGSGKTTLLRTLAGIYLPTRGQVTIWGRSASLIDATAGFQRDLTLKENVFLAGSLYGISKQEMREKFRSITEFAGLTQEIDAPLQSFSAGMIMRVGFALGMSLQPDIFLIDEVLAVGDESFKVQSLEKVSEMRALGKTIVLGSHELPLVKEFCDRVIVLERGRIVHDADPEESIDAYCELLGVDVEKAMSRPPVEVARMRQIERKWKRR